MRRRKWFWIILFPALAALLTLFKVPLASSQGTTLIAAQVSGDLPLEDPDAALWQQATAIEVPLSAQNVAKPILLETRVKSVSARALHNESSVAILVEWSDSTQDDQMVRVQDFRDAVALQFPLAEDQPFFCMGMQGGNVDIWHWKADWQADIFAWQDMESAYPDMAVDRYPFTTGDDMPSPAEYEDVNYVPALAADNLFASPRSSPVEDIVAGGFGTLTAEPAASQNVQGFGTWQDGKWRVIFSREMASPEAEDASFTPGKVYSIAFAAWDGDNDERNGTKSTSQWVGFQLQAAAQAPALLPETAEQAETGGIPQLYITWGIIGLFLLLVLAGAIIYIRLPE
jgi:DMSO reductase family type II enzyme heme b subunit